MTEGVLAPPVFDAERLLPIETPPGSALTDGIDPKTLSSGNDGVFRHVLVARNAGGALNVVFEAMRCQTAKMKTLARRDNRSAWNVSQTNAWLPRPSQGTTRRAMLLASNGVWTTAEWNDPDTLQNLQLSQRVTSD